MITDPLSLWKAVSVDSCRLPISTFQSPMAAVALDVMGRGLVQQFDHDNTGGFLPLPLERRKSDTRHLPVTPTASPNSWKPGIAAQSKQGKGILKKL
jgi:hypothetical protein